MANAPHTSRLNQYILDKASSFGSQNKGVAMKVLKWLFYRSNIGLLLVSYLLPGRGRRSPLKYMFLYNAFLKVFHWFRARK